MSFYKTINFEECPKRQCPGDHKLLSINLAREDTCCRADGGSGLPVPFFFPPIFRRHLRFIITSCTFESCIFFYFSLTITIKQIITLASGPGIVTGGVFTGATLVDSGPKPITVKYVFPNYKLKLFVDILLINNKKFVGFYGGRRKSLGTDVLWHNGGTCIINAVIFYVF